MKHRIGIYPGTFDPLHQGHLAFCMEAIKRGHVDDIILLPEHSPRSKPLVTAFSQRFILLNKAVASFPHIRVERVTSKRFTVKETLPELQRRFKRAELCMLVGSDIVPALHTWDGLDVLLSEAPLLIGMRQSDSLATVRATMERIGQSYAEYNGYAIIEAAHSDVASSRIRRGEMVVDFSTLQ